MKKTIAIFIALMTGYPMVAQIQNGEFNGTPSFIPSAGIQYWQKGCSYNPSIDPSYNNPEVIYDGSSNVLELEGYYYSGPSHSLESAQQYVGPLSAGQYTITFDAKNRLNTSGNPGLQLIVTLKSYSGCDPGGSSYQLFEAVQVPLVSTWSSHTVNICIPPSLDGVMTHIELAAMHQNNLSVICNGTFELDNITMTKNDYNLDYDYKIDCLTGQVKVRPHETLSNGFYDMFILMENNPLDPYNLSGTGDIQLEGIAYWGYTIDSQGWYVFNTVLDPTKNYYLKRGIWNSCVSWKEQRKYNVEIEPNTFNSTFTHSITCDGSNQATITLYGAAQSGSDNPFHMFSLFEVGGTSPVASAGYWQQSNAGSTSTYVYQNGPFVINAYLNPTKSYYIKRGVWDVCTPWAESRDYDIACPESGKSGRMSSSQQVIGDVYPNPASDVLNVRLDEEFTTIEIVSLSGKLLASHSTKTMDVSLLSPGFYFVKVYNNQGLIFTKQFVKE